MFTGLIEEIGRVKTMVRVTAGAELRVLAPRTAASAQVGDSISISGVCLTVTKAAGEELSFDAVKETLSKTTLGRLKAGDSVNIERSVSADRLFGGHFVLGHVDGTGIITNFDRRSGAAILTIQAGDEIIRCIVPKGSIAVDGISLTVASCSENEFNIAIIPHTFENTTLGSRRRGDTVNLETDILGKYVEKFMAGHSAGQGITAQLLADAGWE
jgi:riboflavin synthase